VIILVLAEDVLSETRRKSVSESYVRGKLEYFFAYYGILAPDLEDVTVDLYNCNKQLYWHCFRVAYSLKGIFYLGDRLVNNRILIKSSMLHNIGSLNESQNNGTRHYKINQYQSFRKLHENTIEIIDGIYLFDKEKILKVMKIFQEQLFFGLEDYMDDAAINLTKIDDKEIKNLCACLLLADYLDFQGVKSRRELKERYQCLNKIFPEYSHLLTALLHNSYYRK